ncbi:carbohydrate ABC transporter permease [Pullulanibacillus sp. KACC 23026]|uniref:carbohydrate ABC transporter permease n=1 Tax=Pullulanibacillus sp. KACC 23026 TaxID=3028315 RepID=UPI0023AFCEDD|nr:carbohydrate ABC transporter permease [Pullulanibacillus sp. KACC 23026]WEG12867.1 carbohydrate ABC transporter permease [Pullulanibacillus sp. KACC 23026]
MAAHTKIKSGKGYNVAFTTFGVIWLIVSFYPVLYILMSSLRTQDGFLSGGPTWLPTLHPTFSNYAAVFQSGFGHYFLNSLIVSVVSVVFIVLFSLLLAYVIVRTKNRAVKIIFNVFLVGLALPIQAAIIPVYILITKLGMYDTLGGIIFPSIAFGIPMTLLFLVNFVREIPNELYESMGLEGASDFQMLRHLVTPLTMPSIISIAIYQFILAWNNFLFPLVLTQSDSVKVMPLAVVQFQGDHTMNIPITMAAVTVSALPLLLAYIFGGRYIRRGMMAGFGK